MTFTSRALARVERGDLCSGCGLCAAVGRSKVAMEVSNQGFLRPRQLERLTPQEERVVSRSCPGLGLTQPTLPGTVEDALLGPVTATRSGYSADPAMRRNASSGGALSALLAFLLEEKEVDYVVQTGADTDLPIGNVSVRSLTRDEIYHAAGSRYAPSAPLADLEEHLSREGRFAFVGKPCDVAALRAMERFDKRIGEKIPYAISFFCAGVPSLDGAREVLRKLNADETRVTAFRYRGDGWPGFASATMDTGESKSMSYADSWGGILSRHVQFRCKICPDGTGGAADVVCADAWACDNDGYPLFEEADGWSLIVSRNQRGEDLVRHAISAGALVASATDRGEIEKMQPGQVKRKALVLSRLLGMAILLKPLPRFVGYNLVSVARSRSPLENAKSFLGTVRRILFPRRRNRTMPSAQRT